MANVLPGVPLVESPLFSLEKTGMGLNAQEEQIAINLNLHGFAVLDFPDPGIGARIERIKGRLKSAFPIDFDDPTSDKRGDFRIQDAWRDDEDVRAIAANDQMVELLGKLYGRKAFPFQTLNFPVGTQQAAHADTAHFSCLPERFMCGVWLAMEDVDPDAGPLFYYPGSHSWPIVSNSLIGRRGYGSSLESAQHPYHAAWSAMCEASGAKPELFEARRGQALIWCANLLHGGSIQRNPALTRWSQVTHYYFDDCIYYTPAFSDEVLGELDVRHPVSASDGICRSSRYLGQVVDKITRRRGGMPVVLPARRLGGKLAAR